MNNIFILDFNFYSSTFLQYFNTGFKGLGPTDDFIEMYCMGSEL